MNFAIVFLSGEENGPCVSVRFHAPAWRPGGKPPEQRQSSGHLLATRPSRAEFFARTLAMYPDRVNPFTVWLNATRLLPA